MFFLRKFFFNIYGYLSLVLTALAFFVVFVMINLLDSYSYSLKKELLSKQAHIYLLYSKDTAIDKNLITKIKNIIDKGGIIIPFLKGKSKIGIKVGDSFAGVNLYANTYIYGFLNYKDFLENGSFKPFETVYKDELKITREGFYTDKDVFVLNDTLNSMFDSPNVNVDKAYITLEDSRVLKNSTILGRYNDFATIPVLYTNISFANKILQRKNHTISGYMIKLNNISKIDFYTKLLREKIANKNLTVSNLTETNTRQIKILDLLQDIFYSFIFILLFITIFMNIMWLYGIILDKQPQINILYDLGIDISNKIILYTTILFGVSSFFGFYISRYISTLAIKYIFSTKEFILTYRYDQFFLFFTIFALTYMILSKNVFLIREKIK